MVRTLSRLLLTLPLTTVIVLWWAPHTARAQSSRFADVLLTKVRAAARFVLVDISSPPRYVGATSSSRGHRGALGPGQGQGRRKRK